MAEDSTSAPPYVTPRTQRNSKKLRAEIILPEHADDVPKFSLLEIIHAVAFENGWTQQELSDALGVTTRGTEYRVARMRKVLEPLRAALRPYCVADARKEAKKIAKAQVDEELEDLLGMSIEAIKEELVGGVRRDKNAWNVIRQLKGTPASAVKMEHGGTVRHDHRHHIMPADLVEAFDADVLGDRDLMQRANRLIPTSQTSQPAAIPIIDVGANEPAR